MVEANDIFIRKMIVHILDQNLGMPVLSDTEHQLNDDIKDFMSKHIAKLFNDYDLKNAFFINHENVVKKSCEKLVNQVQQFSEMTRDIAQYIYQVINNHSSISSADLVCCLFEFKNIKYLGILKFNYKPSYIHHVEENSEGRVNSIIKQKTALPNENQKLEESMLINLTDYSISIKEKKFEIDGEKQFYISTKILECTSDISEREKVDLLNKSTKKFVKQYYNEDVLKMADIKNVFAKSVEEKSEINLNEIADRVFKEDQEMKDIYIEEVKKGGLNEGAININENLEKRVNRKQRLITDNGIEIKLPLEYMKRREKVEFISNQDGTLSILIKNISCITDK